MKQATPGLGVIPSAAVFQAERGIWRASSPVSLHAGFLAPLVRARGFGMTHLLLGHKVEHTLRQWVALRWSVESPRLGKCFVAQASRRNSEVKIPISRAQNAREMGHPALIVTVDVGAMLERIC